MIKTLAFSLLLWQLPVFMQESARLPFELIHNIAGIKTDEVRSVAVGADGSIYIAGLTNSPDFVTTSNSASQTLVSGRSFQASVFVRKLSSEGTLIYSTFVGQSRFDWPVAMAVDREGNVFVACRQEDGIGDPVVSLEPAASLTVVKLSPDGGSFRYRVSVLPEAFYGPPIGLAVDSSGAVYVATGESGFGIRRISPDGSRIAARTTVRCKENERLRVNALALGTDNSVYVAGRSECRDFPATPGAFRQFAVEPQNGDGFLIRLQSDLSQVTYATLLGGESSDEAVALTIAGDQAIVGGYTGVGTGLDPMPATPVGFAQVNPNSRYGFLAAVSSDGASVNAAIYPVSSIAAVSHDEEGGVYGAGASSLAALFLKVSPDLRTIQYIVEPPARAARILSIVSWKHKFVFGGSASTIGFPNNDPNFANSRHGFAGVLGGIAAPADLSLEVETVLAPPETFGEFTTCRYKLTNRGPVDATNLLLAASIEENASFQLWRADSNKFNVPTFFTGFAGPSLAGVASLSAGETTTIEFLSANLIFSSGVRCSGYLYSATPETDLSDNSASTQQVPQWTSVNLTAPIGVEFRRDDWPLIAAPYPWLRATPGTQMRLFFPSPQKAQTGITRKFTRWSDGSTENPRVFTIPETTLNLIAVFTTVPDGTPLSTDPEGSPWVPKLQDRETPIHVNPPELKVQDTNLVINVNGTGLRQGWEVLWNGQPRPTEYLSQYQLRVTLRPGDVERASLGWISVRDPEHNALVRAPHAFWVYLGILSNDVIYDRTRSRVWVAMPSAPGETEHRVALVEPETGIVERNVAVAIEPKKLALTDEASYLYVAGSGRIIRLNTESLEVDRDFPIPQTQTGSLLPEAYSLLAVPGRPDQVLVSLYAPFVSPGYQGTILFDRGTPAARQLGASVGPALLYGWVDERTAVGGGGGGGLSYLTVEDGVALHRAVSDITTSPNCVLENDRLYCSSGEVLDAASGLVIRKYPARGAAGLLSDRDMIVFLDLQTQIFVGGALYGPMVTVRQSSGDFLSATIVPHGGSPGSFIRMGGDRLLFRPTGSNQWELQSNRLYSFTLP